MSALLTPAPSPTMSPPASRASRPTWRDPRLAVGILLVCGSVLGGAKVLAGADDTVAVLTAARPLAAGERLTAEDLTTVRLRFDAAADADRYVAGDADDVSGSVLSRPVGQGELVPRAALAGTTESLVELPLGVDPGRVPAAVRTGSLVDVWVTPPAGQEGAAELLLEGVPVLAASRGAGSVSGTRQVVVGVRPDEELARIVSRLGEEASVLVVARDREG